MVARKIDPNRKAKKCSLCEQELPREDFYENKRNKDGMSSMCKKCQSVFSSLRVYAKMSKDKLNEEFEGAHKKIQRIRRFLAGEELIDIARSERKGQ